MEGNGNGQKSTGNIRKKFSSVKVCFQRKRTIEKIFSENRKCPLPEGSGRSFPKSLAEFAAAAAKKFKSFLAEACTSTKIPLSLRVWKPAAPGGRFMHGSNCNPFAGKARQGFSGRICPLPEGSGQRGCSVYTLRVHSVMRRPGMAHTSCHSSTLAGVSR